MKVETRCRFSFFILNFFFSEHFECELLNAEGNALHASFAGSLVAGVPAGLRRTMLSNQISKRICCTHAIYGVKSTNNKISMKQDSPAPNEIVHVFRITKRIHCGLARSAKINTKPASIEFMYRLTFILFHLIYLSIHTRFD